MFSPNFIYVNSGPGDDVYVGECGGKGWPVVLEADNTEDDVSIYQAARLNVRRPTGCTPEEVLWDLTFTSDDATARPAFYAFKGADVGKDPPDLEKSGYYDAVLEVHTGDNRWIQFGRPMRLKVLPRR